MYRVRLLPEAEADLLSLYSHICAEASPELARAYLLRIRRHLAGFDVFPERGMRRDEIRPGLRLVGFERRITLAFIIEGDLVVFTNILYAGRRLPSVPGSIPASEPRQT